MMVDSRIRGLRGKSDLRLNPSLCGEKLQTDYPSRAVAVIGTWYTV